MESPISSLAAGASTMRKRRYEMLLPLTHNDGRPVDPAKHGRTHEELVARFGAFHTFPLPCVVFGCTKDSDMRRNSSACSWTCPTRKRTGSSLSA